MRGSTPADKADTAALRKSFARRRKGRFVGVQEMDKRLDAMIAEKRRETPLRNRLS